MWWWMIEKEKDIETSKIDRESAKTVHFDIYEWHMTTLTAYVRLQTMSEKKEKKESNYKHALHTYMQ